jgi:hypothetical protein
VGRKTITNARPPSYVSRETGAAELDMSTDTWDAMVKAGRLPQPLPAGISGTTPRWRWSDVEKALGGSPPVAPQSEPEPFFRGLTNGKAKERGRVAS